MMTKTVAIVMTLDGNLIKANDIRMTDMSGDWLGGGGKGKSQKTIGPSSDLCLSLFSTSNMSNLEHPIRGPEPDRV